MSKSKEMKQLKELYQEATTTGAPEYAKRLSDLMTSEKIQKAIKRELNDPNSSNVDDLILLLQVANIIDNNSGESSIVLANFSPTVFESFIAPKIPITNPASENVSRIIPFLNPFIAKSNNKTAIIMSK